MATMALLLNVFIKSLFRCRQFLLNFINELITEHIWALLQESLSDYTKYAQLQRIHVARILKLSLLVESRFNSTCTLQKVNNKGADQTAQMQRLVCAFAVHMHQSQIFSGQAFVTLLCPSSLFVHRLLVNIDPRVPQIAIIIIPFIPHQQIQVKGSQITVKW